MESGVLPLSPVTLCSAVRHRWEHCKFCEFQGGQRTREHCRLERGKGGLQAVDARWAAQMTGPWPPHTPAGNESSRTLWSYRVMNYEHHSLFRG